MTLDVAKLRAAQRGYRAVFFEALGRPVGPWEMFQMMVPSSGPSEVYNWLSMSPAVKEWLDDRKREKLRALDYTLVNRLWENSLEIPRVDVEDDNLGLYPMKFRQMAQNFQLHKNALLFSLMENGDGTTLGNSYDGLSFFNTSHIDFAGAASGTQSNLITAVLAEASYEAAWAQMIQFKGNDGEYMNISPTHIVVPPQLTKTAQGIVDRPFSTGGESNINNGEVEVVTAAWLSGSPTQWYLADLSKELKPFIYQNRAEVEFTSRLDPESSDALFERDDFEFGGRARYEIGYGFWQTMLMSDGTV